MSRVLPFRDPFDDPFRLAVVNGKIEQVETLLEEDTSRLERPLTFNGGRIYVSPLILATYLDQTEVMKVLIDRGANLKSTARCSCGAVDCGCGATIPIRCIHSSQALAILKDAGATVDEETFNAVMGGYGIKDKPALLEELLKDVRPYTLKVSLLIRDDDLASFKIILNHFPHLLNHENQPPASHPLALAKRLKAKKTFAYLKDELGCTLPPSVAALPTEVIIELEAGQETYKISGISKQDFMPTYKTMVCAKDNPSDLDLLNALQGWKFEHQSDPEMEGPHGLIVDCPLKSVGEKNKLVYPNCVDAIYLPKQSHEVSYCLLGQHPIQGKRWVCSFGTTYSPVTLEWNNAIETPEIQTRGIYLVQYWRQIEGVDKRNGFEYVDGIARDCWFK